MVGISGGFLIFPAFHLGSRASDMRMGCKVCVSHCLSASHPHKLIQLVPSSLGHSGLGANPSPALGGAFPGPAFQGEGLSSDPQQLPGPCNPHHRAAPVGVQRSL